MTKAEWLRLAIVTPPLAVAAFIVAAALGPYGVLMYLAMLLFGVNAPRLFRPRKPAPKPRTVYLKERKR